MYGNEKTPAGYGPNVNYDSGSASMDPYTTQILNRLGEADKYLTEVTIQLSRIADKLVGGSPEAAMLDRVPTAKSTLGGGIMEQIVGQANILSRKISDLGNIANRLQSL
jgi:hypothetical protein